MFDHDYDYLEDRGDAFMEDYYDRHDGWFSDFDDFEDDRYLDEEEDTFADLDRNWGFNHADFDGE